MMNKELFSEKYQVEGEIASGGMGVIYKARHTSLNSQVAIKVLHAQYGKDPSFIQRFLREARAMARLDHENIVKVFDVAQEGDTHYIVMEYFPGRDVKHLLREKGCLSIPETLLIGLKVAEALAYAHSQGIIHRDIKPANVMVDDRGRVKITDFGIAAAAGDISVTTTGEILGTPEYMSPEQARGEHMDGRTDLYSLGMLMFQMLMGQTPYTGMARMSIMGKLVYDPEEHKLSFSAETPEALQALVRMLLKKQPQDRIPDAKTLVDRIVEIRAQFGGSVEGGEGTALAMGQPSWVSREEDDPTMVRPEETVVRPEQTLGLSEAPAPAALEPLQEVKPSRFRRFEVSPYLAGGIGAVILIAVAVYLFSRPWDGSMKSTAVPEEPSKEFARPSGADLAVPQKKVSAGASVKTETPVAEVFAYPTPDACDLIKGGKVTESTLRTGMRVGGSKVGDRRIEAGLNKHLFNAGEEVQLTVDIKKDSYLYVFNLYQDRSVTLLFPNRFSRENFFRASNRLVFPDEELKKQFRLRVYPFPETEHSVEEILVLATDRALDLSQTTIQQAFKIYGGEETGTLERLMGLSSLQESNWMQERLTYCVEAG